MLRLLFVIPLALLAVSTVVGTHFYLVHRLVDEPSLPALPTALLGWGVALLGGTLVLQPISERLLRPPWTRIIAWPASLWMGFFFLLAVAVGATDLLLWLGAAVASAAEPGDAASSVSVARTRALFVLGGVGAAGALAIRTAMQGPLHKRLEIRLRRWPAALDGLRIVQISDIHIGPLLDREFAAELTARVNALEPDLVAVTGDLVDGPVALLRDEVAPFGELRGRLGVFFVTGNHDHYSGARDWAAEAGRLGMRVLRNEHVVLGREGARFTLAGVDDHNSRHLPGAQGEDLDAALADVDPELPLVLLAHDPSTFKRASSLGIDLQLSGHTHGGQIWPFAWMVRIAIPFVAGLHRKGDALLYVSRGTGFWGPPMRLGAPAEITEIVLRAPEAPAPPPAG